MNIRHAVSGDLDTLADIEARSYPRAEAASLESIRARIEKFANHFWLLDGENGIVAFINGMVTDSPDLTDEMYDRAELHNEDGTWQMIFSVVTAPEFRGQGCADKLMRRVIDDCRSQDRAGIVLTCKERLLPFYAKFGFVSEGISASDHGGAQWYQMRLSF